MNCSPRAGIRGSPPVSAQSRRGDRCARNAWTRSFLTSLIRFTESTSVIRDMETRLTLNGYSARWISHEDSWDPATRLPVSKRLIVLLLLLAMVFPAIASMGEPIRPEWGGERLPTSHPECRYCQILKKFDPEEFSVFQVLTSDFSDYVKEEGVSVVRCRLQGYRRVEVVASLIPTDQGSTLAYTKGWWFSWRGAQDNNSFFVVRFNLDVTLADRYSNSDWLLCIASDDLPSAFIGGGLRRKLLHSYGNVGLYESLEMVEGSSCR